MKPTTEQQPKAATSADTKFKERPPVVEAWNVAKLYRDDAQKAKRTRKPRLPLSTIGVLQKASVSFDKACSLLDVTPTHLRAACQRAEITLGADDAPAQCESVLDTMPATLVSAGQTKGIDVMALNAILNPTDAGVATTVAQQKRDGRKLGADEVASLIRTTSDALERKYGKQPSYSLVQRETGFNLNTVKKYMKRNSTQTSATTASETAQSGAGSDACKFDFDEETIQVVSEIVFGTTLIKGTFVGPDGDICCDEIEKSGTARAAMIYEWRNHVATVSKVLTTARDLLI
jgi:hypothetical protein